MDLFREWSKDVAKKVENAVDEVVKEVDNVSASVSAVQNVQPVVSVQTKVVSRIDIKTADRNELIQFIKDQNQHLNRLQLANKQCEQRIVQLEEQKLQHLEMINTLNEDLKHSNEELKMNIEGTKKLVQENQNQKTILENSRKLALENEELKLVIEKLTIAAEKASADLMPQPSGYGSYGSVKKTGINVQDVIYDGGYGSYGSVNPIHFHERSEKKNKSSKRKKEKKRKTKPRMSQESHSEHDLIEELELKNEPEEASQAEISHATDPESPAQNIQEISEDFQENNVEKEPGNECPVHEEVSSENQANENVLVENENAESLEGAEADAVHSINKENEQSKTKFKKAKEALAAKRQSLRLEKSGSLQILKEEQEKAENLEEKEKAESNEDHIKIQEAEPENQQQNTSEVQTNKSLHAVEAEKPTNTQVQSKSRPSVKRQEESKESEEEDSEYSEEESDSDEDSDTDDSSETDSEDKNYNRRMFGNQQRRAAPVYSRAQEQVNNQIVQQSVQQKQQLKFQQQQIEQLKEDKKQLLEEIQDQHKQLEEVMTQQQQNKKLQKQLIKASNTISELESLKKREKLHSEELEKQVQELKSKIEETNEQFSSYRRRAQALIEQNETSYSTEGNDVLPTNEEKNIYLDKLKEMEQENASLKGLYSEEQVSNKNKISLLEQKYEKVLLKLKDTQLIVNKLEGELTTSKEDAEKAIVALKANYEKEQMNESAKYKENYRLLEEKLNNVRANSFNQLRDKDLKITQLQDTLEMKNEEYLKILREREKEKEQQNVFPPSNSKINTSNPLLIEHIPLRPVIITNKPEESLASVKSEEKDEDTFLAFVGSQAKKEKEIQKALESLEHHKSLLAETEATNALLLEQLSTLKQEIRKIDQRVSPINLELLRATFINYLCSNNSEELYSTLAGLLNLTQNEKQAIATARKSANGWRLW